MKDKKIHMFIIDLRDFCYFAIYKNRGKEMADMFYKGQVKSMIVPYFLASIFGLAAVLFRLGIKIPDIADGNILIMLVVGGCVVLIYNLLLAPLQLIYTNYPIDLEKIERKYKSLRVRFVLFFIVGLLLMPIVPYLITIMYLI